MRVRRRWLSPAVARIRAALIGATMIAVGCGGAPQPVDPGAAEAASPALILVSLDGFRWDYRSLTETPHLDALAAAGVTAESLIPTFPSKTFPSHYSIVTGLYPGNHDVISNNMRDPGWDGEFGLGSEELLKPRWWGGEPIWIAVKRHGMATASYFWPGSDVAIKGERPDHFFAYDGSVPFEDRVDQVLAWLELPGGEQPSFVTLYFAEPNETAHRFGPQASRTLAQVRRVDAMIGRLLDGLRDRDRLAATNVVVVADHGMAQMSPERIIRLDEYVTFQPGELFEQGAFVQIFPGPGREPEIFGALQSAHPNLAVYRRDDLPERYHLSGHRRLGSIVAVPDIGWTARGGVSIDSLRASLLLGDHGGDPNHPDMRGIFIAAGPAFARGVTLPPFENIEIYNVMAHALGITPAPNDGDLTRVAALLAGAAH